MRGALCRVTVPHPECSAEVVLVSGQDTSWIPSWQEVGSVFRRETVQCWTRSKDGFSQKAPVCIHLEELQEAAGERKVWVSLLRLLPETAKILINRNLCEDASKIYNP